MLSSLSREQLVDFEVTIQITIQMLAGLFIFFFSGQLSHKNRSFDFLTICSAALRIVFMDIQKCLGKPVQMFDLTVQILLTQSEPCAIGEKNTEIMAQKCFHKCVVQAFSSTFLETLKMIYP